MGIKDLIEMGEDASLSKEDVIVVTKTLRRVGAEGFSTA